MVLVTKADNIEVWPIDDLQMRILVSRDHIINPLCAKFLRENINICLHLMSFLHTNKTQVVEIPPQVRQGLAYST